MQTYIVAGIVLLAAGYVVLRLLRRLGVVRGDAGCGCGCDGCSGGKSVLRARPKSAFDGKEPGLRNSACESCAPGRTGCCPSQAGMQTSRAADKPDRPAEKA